jgi:DNA primase
MCIRDRIYNDLIHNYISNSEFEIANYLNLMSEEQASIISDLIMENERYTLAGWLEKKQVFVKEKDSQEVMTNLVTETLISLREYLINKLIMDLMQSFQSESGSDIEELKNNINDYNKLKVNLTNKIGRIRSTYL